MLVKITGEIKYEDFIDAINDECKTITIDLKEKKGITKGEINKLLLLNSVGQKIELINVNSKIINFIKSLKFDKQIVIRNVT